VPALLFGVALGNVIQGVPFHFDDTMRSFYTGSFLGVAQPVCLIVRRGVGGDAGVFTAACI
jgi:cytochrome d ubiquinol oxidase subunit II